jgi:hypothetical protein
MQYTYNVTMRSLHETIVVVEKPYILHIYVCVCVCARISACVCMRVRVWVHEG